MMLKIPFIMSNKILKNTFNKKVHKFCSQKENCSTLLERDISKRPDYTGIDCISGLDDSTVPRNQFSSN